jgi:hypothetical protein
MKEKKDTEGATIKRQVEEKEKKRKRTNDSTEEEAKIGA